MTAYPVPFNDRQISYTAVGGETSFATDFPVFAETDLEVRRTRAAVTTTLVLTTDYTVSIAVATGIATITPVAAVLAADVWVLSGETVIERTSDLPQRPTADTMADLNDEFDRIIMMLQEVVRDIVFAGGSVVDATTSVKGIIEIATNAEFLAKTATDKAVVPSNRAAIPIFSAHKNGVSQTGLVSTVATKVTFGTEEYDIGSYFASSTFTPLVAGKYILASAVRWVNTNAVDNEQLEISIYKNGVAYKSEIWVRAGTSFQQTSITAIVDANGTTDFFEIYATKNGAGNGDIQGVINVTYFQGMLIA